MARAARRGARWPGLLAAGFVLNALRSTLLAAGHGNVGLQSAAWPWTAALAVASLALVTAALIDYVNIQGRLARRLNLASVALAAITLLAVEARWLTRGEALQVATVFFVGWMALFVQAMRREPRSGHGLVLVALLAFPVGAVALRTGLMPFELMPVTEIVPLAAIGLIVLTAGLIRAHQRAQHEAVVAARALAARARAEGELRAANESLEQRVAQRTRELRETIEGLESFNRSVSHDLRGPLGGIAGVARLARELAAKGDLAQADHMVAAIERQADESMRMIAALLALARAGDAQPRRSRFQVGPLVDEAIAATVASASGVAVVVCEMPVVEADRELLRQVFVNLIGNARKFAHGAAEPRGEVGHAPTSSGDAFYVRDNGVGFPQEEAERLFRPFHRLHGARFEGFGVGLSIVRRIVDHHGGRAWAEGAPGRGATFWFTLDGGKTPAANPSLGSSTALR